MGRLFLQDLANIEAGIYPVPADHDGSLFTLINRSRLFFTDLPEIHRRRQTGAHSEIFNTDTPAKRPRYYLQNFHFQSGGWMTDDSAERYDTQVEVLLNGTANAMRRKRCRSSTNCSPDVISANCGCSTLAAAPDDFSIS
jgi:hypothetical protein